MSIPEYTTVVGVDKEHLQQLWYTWPTWRHHKPSLLQHPMLVFFDPTQVTERMVLEVVDHPNMITVPWTTTQFAGDANDKWSNPQRHKMLAGFVHIPPACVQTPYWLKLDADTIALGNDHWISEQWFENNPAIVAQAWGLTKPADQMVRLDRWSAEKGIRFERPPLNLIPEEGAKKICHKRIISWCGFFAREFTLTASLVAISGSSWGQRYELPVPSQDGYMWYVATRLGLPVVRIQAKSRGWTHVRSMESIKTLCKASMND